MKLLSFFLAAAALHFDITDERGKRASGVTIEAAGPDVDGWCDLKISKSKGSAVLVWPFDGRAKVPDGPEPVPVIVVEGPVSRPAAVAAIVAGELLGVKHSVALDAGVVTNLVASEDSFQKGVGLLYAKKPEEAVDPLARALKDRERQLTRVPSEIYAAAMLYGHALFDAKKFDDAAVAFLKARNQRPSDAAARKARAEALIQAGKPEAAEQD